MCRERRPHVGHSMAVEHGCLAIRMGRKCSRNGIASLRVHRLFVPIAFMHSTGEPLEPSSGFWFVDPRGPLPDPEVTPKLQEPKWGTNSAARKQNPSVRLICLKFLVPFLAASSVFLTVPELRMERSSPVDGSPSASRRARGRPRKEAIERENLAKMLNSNLTNDVSKRFLQKMNLLKAQLSKQRCLTCRGNES